MTQQRYRLIADELECEIAAMAPGSKLDSEHTLMDRFGVGRAAARAAVQELERRLRVRRVQGAGTFVTKRIDYVISRERPPSWHRTVREAGGQPRSTMLDRAIEPLPADCAVLLEAPVGTPTHRLMRMNYIARNVSPSPTMAKAFRIFIVTVRGIPDLVIAIIFIVITGLGSTAGALALTIGAVGLLSKLIADSLEETDVRVQHAVAAGGASRAQTFVAATLRQSAPALAAHLFYQLDVNIRAATLLGIVGAGGIGFYLLNAARVMNFEVVTTIVLMVFAVVMAIEAIAMWLRRAMS